MSRAVYPGYFDNDILVTTSVGTWIPVSGPACVISLSMINHKRQDEFREKLRSLYNEYSKIPGLKLLHSEEAKEVDSN